MTDPLAVRRRTVAHAAWAGPVIAVAAAAPANAATSQEGPRLTFDPADSQLDLLTDVAGDRSWRFALRSAQIRSEAPIDIGKLAMTVTFIPADGEAANPLADLGRPRDWSPQTRVRQDTLEYLYGFPVSANGSVDFTPGDFFVGTAHASPGTLRLTFTATSTADVSLVPAVYEVAVPQSNHLEFQPGDSWAKLTVEGQWGVDFRGASVLARGGEFGPNELVMSATFVPAKAGLTHWLQVSGAQPALWLNDSIAETQETVRFAYAPETEEDRNFAKIQDGMYFWTVAAEAESPAVDGKLVVTFSAPGFSTASYELPAPGKPQLAVRDGEFGSLVDAWSSEAPWTLYLDRPTVAVGGAPLGIRVEEGDLTCTIDYVPAQGLDDADLKILATTLPSWSRPGGVAGESARTAVYVYDEDLVPGKTATLQGSDGPVESSLPAGRQQGSVRLTWSAPGVEPAVLEVPIPEI